MPGALQVFALSVAACLTYPAWLHCRRDLDVVEIFAGVASIVGAAMEAGYQSMAFDKSRVPGLTDSQSSKASEDVTCEHGLLGDALASWRVVVARPGLFLLDVAECLQDDFFKRNVRFGGGAAAVAVLGCEVMLIVFEK